MSNHIELVDHDLTNDETQTAFVVAWIDGQGGGFDYAHDRKTADAMTHESLGAPDGVQLYTYMVTMPFGESFKERIADTFVEHIEGHFLALRLAEKG